MHPPFSVPIAPGGEKLENWIKPRTLPALAGKRTGVAARKGFLPYFALLGLAYMFVEVALIQKLILPLEDPPVAVAAILDSLLISSGIGNGR